MDEIETFVIQLRPVRYTRWNMVSMGLNFASDTLEHFSGWLGTFAVAAAQHDMQMREDKKFGEIVSGS
jgi:hypothetical protein